MSKEKKKVFVALSGGVDSSVATLLLKQKGYNLVGCFIKGWYPEGLACAWKNDRRDAMKVCAKLGIPFVTIDAEKAYKNKVVKYMLKEYRAGRTPNPDVMCNKNIKFGVFLKEALKMGADYIATGHYVRLQENQLFQAKDKNKDQSYFLWALKEKQLKHCIFPLGDILKPEVRELAKKHKLPTAEKKDSQGVCFIGEFNMMDFLKRYIKPKKGDIITPDGEKIGEHEGAVFYTLGQRHGFGGGGGTPYYIVDKNIKKNLLTVSDKKGERNFYEKEIQISNTNWINKVSLPAGGLNKKYKARIRYRQPLQACSVDFKSSNEAKVVFSKPQRAVTPGQSLVIYDGQKMLGGGIIK